MDFPYYRFECGTVLRPNSEWLNDLLVLFFDRLIDADTLIAKWSEKAIMDGISAEALRGLEAWAAACLGVVVA